MGKIYLHSFFCLSDFVRRWGRWWYFKLTQQGEIGFAFQSKEAKSVIDLLLFQCKCQSDRQKNLIKMWKKGFFSLDLHIGFLKKTFFFREKYWIASFFSSDIYLKLKIMVKWLDNKLFTMKKKGSTWTKKKLENLESRFGENFSFTKKYQEDFFALKGFLGQSTCLMRQDNKNVDQVSSWLRWIYLSMQKISTLLTKLIFHLFNNKILQIWFQSISSLQYGSKVVVIILEMDPDLTLAYFLPTENKGSGFDPCIFFTQPGDIFLTRLAFFWEKFSKPGEGWPNLTQAAKNITWPGSKNIDHTLTKPESMLHQTNLRGSLTVRYSAGNSI